MRGLIIDDCLPADITFSPIFTEYKIHIKSAWCNIHEIDPYLPGNAEHLSFRMLVATGVISLIVVFSL